MSTSDHERDETYDSPTRRGEPETATEQKEKDTTPKAIRELQTEFEQLFKSKTWKGVHNLPKGSSNRRALVVAINYGERRPPRRLYGTFVDALRIIRMLEKFNYKPVDICVLADIVMPDSADDFESDSSEDGDSESRLPKKVNILKGLKWLGSGTGSDQYRFLYFSGHGHHQPYNSSISNQCIMPEDVKFQRLNRCSECVCSANVWHASDQQEGPSLVPEPLSVLWDHVINQRLSGSLKPGTKFTAVFDCCHSGGMLENAFQNGTGEELINSSEPNSKGRRQYGVAGTNVPLPGTWNQEGATGQILLPPEDVIMTDLSVEQTPLLIEGLDPTSNLNPQESQLISADSPSCHSMTGNFLGLPVEIDLISGRETHITWPRNMDFIQPRHEKTQNISQSSLEKPGTQFGLFPPDLWAILARNHGQTTSPPAEAPQPSSVFTCQLPGMRATMKPFAEGCKVVCWAACRKVESALEDKKNAGRFTEAFTEFLSRPRNAEETQLPRSTEVLINHLRTKFTNYNEEARKNGWDKQQHPKLFVSDGVKVESYLQKEPDI